MRVHSGQKLFTVLAVVAAFAIVGCGDSNEPITTVKADSLLISSSDLKKVSGFGVTPPEQCGPMSMLEGGRAAMSKTFIVPEAQVSQAVGIFPSDKEASSAYKRLNEKSRLGCIGQVIANVAPNLTVQLSRQPIGAGEAATRNRYRILDGTSKIRGFADVMAIKLGRCVTALLVAAQASKPPDKVADSTIATAADLLSGPCR